MKILLCSIGSRGDVQPFLVLGDYLARHGHEVRVASAELYAPLAADYQVDYRPFPGDYAALIDDEKMKEAIGRNPLALRKALRETVYPIIEGSIQHFYELSDWADVIVYHPKTLIDSFGAQCREKLLKAYVVPVFTPTAAFRNPVLEFLPLPTWLNRFSYKLANALLGSVKTPLRNFWRKNKLPPGSLLLDTPTIYGISPALLERPTDYPDDHHYTGFWLPPEEDTPLDPAVEAFVADEREVLLITYGSMPYKSNIPIQTFIQAILDQFDIKILLVKAWGLKAAIVEENDDVMAIDRAPFTTLFPKVDYVMHHGGAGTTATALRAGIPQFICPVLHPFGDQYFWGRQLVRKGVGVAPVPLAKLNPRTLIQRIGALRQKDLRENARRLSEAVRAEDGLEVAKKIIEGMDRLMVGG